MKKVEQEMPVNKTFTTNEYQCWVGRKNSQNEEVIDDMKKGGLGKIAITIDVHGASLGIGME